MVSWGLLIFVFRVTMKSRKSGNPLFKLLIFRGLGGYNGKRTHTRGKGAVNATYTEDPSGWTYCVPLETAKNARNLWNVFWKKRSTIQSFRS